MIRFIHAADLHLDSPFKGLKQLHPTLFEAVYQSTFQSFQNIVTSAIENKIDFLLISGDIYDEENQSVKAQAFFRDQMKRLEEADIMVYLLHGNHDFMGRNSLRIQMPPNVIIFDVKPETHLFKTRGNETVAISGFSYPTRWVKERMIEQYPKRHRQAEFHIGMLHGYLEGSASKEGVYAPFSINDLLDLSYDYWALGHIHKREILYSSPFIIYPGNIQGRNPNETGAKGAYLITMEKGSESTQEFISTAPIKWKEKRLSLESVGSLQSLYAKIEEECEREAEENQKILLSITLDEYLELPKDVIKKIQDGDLLAGINQSMGQHMVYLYKLILAPKKEQLLFRYDESMQGSFEKSGQAFLDEEKYQDTLQDLFKNSIIRGRFSELENDKELRDEILEAAKRVLFEDIAFEEGEETS